MSAFLGNCHIYSHKEGELAVNQFNIQSSCFHEREERADFIAWFFCNGISGSDLSNGKDAIAVCTTLQS